MSVQDGTCKFDLTRVVKYHSHGQPQEADYVILKEPCMDHVSFYLKLKQMITRSQMELAKQAGEINKLRDSIGDVVKTLDEDADRIESETDMLHDGIVLALESSETVDISKFMETFAKMACLKARKSICMVGGELAMTSAIWSNLKPDDAFNIAVRWCSFFAMPSEGGVKISSDQPSESHMERMEV